MATAIDAATLVASSSSSSSFSSSSSSSIRSLSSSFLAIRNISSTRRSNRLYSEVKKMNRTMAHITVCPPQQPQGRSSPTTTSPLLDSNHTSKCTDSPSPAAIAIAAAAIEQQVSSIIKAATSRAREPKQSPGMNPSWNLLQKLAAATLDFVENKLIPKLEGDSLPSTSDPAVQLAGNFAPVSESPVHHELEIQGKLPQCLQGVYIRNGANPKFAPIAGHHLFDGDGMLHAVRFNNGVASYCSRYTRTHRLMEEEKLGRAYFPKAVGELHGHGGAARLLLFYARSLFGLVDASKGMGPANAGVVFFDGKLLAMSEDDQPYAIKIRDDGDLETIGRWSFDGQLNSSMIAHPKKDPRTGELFALSYDVVKKPYLKYFMFSADGVKGPDVEITLDEATMMHDFAITDRFVVIPDQQVVFRLQRMLSGESPVVFDAAKKSRFGILPKYDSNEKRMIWIEVPDCFCFHVWNAWEDGEDEVVVLGSCMTPPDCVFNESESSEPMNSILCEIRLNVKTGTSKRTPIANLNLEAGQVNLRFLGKKNRFLYLAIADPWPKISGIAKVDLQAPPTPNGKDCVVGKRIHGQDRFGGEPFFVSRTSDPDAAEDDGYVLTFVHDESTGNSELHVLDASSRNLDLVAAVKLPSRVPYGFHGTYVAADELAHQH